MLPKVSHCMPSLGINIVGLVADTCFQRSLSACLLWALILWVWWLIHASKGLSLRAFFGH